MEIVVVDDGSTDKTPSSFRVPAASETFAEEEQRSSVGVQCGFSETHGEIVALLDGDDWWKKGKLAAVLDVLIRIGSRCGKPRVLPI